MGTGQDIQEVKQSVSFYNTTGVIEYHKNIYYCPIFKSEDFGEKVNLAYLTRFEEVCPPDSDYKDIKISRWSPEDRTLSVKGNVDNFRGRFQTYGKGLNYCILKREVGGTSTFYYAFFIKEVRQSGANSVDLTLEVDDWTNTFYLLNPETLTEGYNQFNDIVKNARIDRQHYDRVDRYGILTNMELFANYPEVYKFRYQYRDFKSPLKFSYSGDIIDYFSKSELEEIDNEDNFDNLSEYLKTRIIKHSIGYVHIVMSSDRLEVIKRMGVDEGRPVVLNTYVGKTQYEDYRHNISSAYRKLVLPFQCDCELLKKYNLNLKFKVNTDKLSHNGVKHFEVDTPRLLQAVMSDKNGYGEYIEGIYISKDSTLDYKITDINTSSLYITYDVKDGYSDNPDSIGSLAQQYCIGFIKDVNVSESGKNDVYMEADKNYTYPDISITNYSRYVDYVVFYEVSPSEINGELLLPEKEIDVKNNYVDNVLLFEPYNFYSISYLGSIETPLSKYRYYGMFDGNVNYIPFDYIYSVGATYKVGIIPYYASGEGLTRYYSESIIYSGNDSLPYVSTAYAEFMTGNKYQMKNQYAVNDYQRGTDLLQRFFNTAPANVASAYVSGTSSGSQGASAGAQAIKEVSGMIDDGIDWAQSTKLISMNQKSKLADLGELPNNIKQSGSDMIYTLKNSEVGFYLNHYTIDKLSEESICKYLERFGYKVDIMDTLNCFNRVGWNFIKVSSCDIDGRLTLSQEENVRRILSEGVSLLHNPDVLENGTHNYETILEV